jgi:diaminopimelate decarboxylase
VTDRCPTDHPMLPGSFAWRQGELHCEQFSMTELAAQFQTPCYIYSARALRSAYQAFATACESLGADVDILYAVKANPNLSILSELAALGAGFDIVSTGEMKRVLAAGGEARKMVFSGVGKTDAELRDALEAGVGCINLESLSEMRRLDQIAATLNCRARVSLRVNPDIDAKTHPYISTGLKSNKFGLPIDQALQGYVQAKGLSHLQIIGVDCHIGSQITELSPFLDAADRVLTFVEALEAQGIQIDHIDLGGGLGICYHDEAPPTPEALMQALVSKVQTWASGRNRPMPKLIFEFGRAIVGPAGVLLSRVVALKPQSSPEATSFAIVDAAMNDLMRPSLYEAWHEILPVRLDSNEPSRSWDVVGPVCESGDWLGRQRLLSLQEGDLVILASAGAYGSSMASNYNSRPRPAEVMIYPDAAPKLIRRRETFEDLVSAERL